MTKTHKPRPIDDVATETAERCARQVFRDPDVKVDELREVIATALRNTSNDVAKLYRLRIAGILDLLGIDPPTPCSSCGKPIRFIATKRGGLMPITIDGIPHFADCPNANQHRRKK